MDWVKSGACLKIVNRLIGSNSGTLSKTYDYSLEWNIFVITRGCSRLSGRRRMGSLGAVVTLPALGLWAKLHTERCDLLTCSHLAILADISTGRHKLARDKHALALGEIG